MTDDRFYLITTENFDETQNAQLLAIVKGNAESWWHEMLNVWIVKGGKPTEWTNSLKIIAGVPNSRYLLLALPRSEAERAWATKLNRSARVWLKDTYTPELAKALTNSDPHPKGPEDEPPF